MGEREKEVHVSRFFRGRFHAFEMGEPRPVGFRGFRACGPHNVLRDEVLFFFDVTLLGGVILRVLFLVELVLEEIFLERPLVTGDGLVLETKGDFRDFREERLVMGNDEEGVRIGIEIGAQPRDLALVEEVRRLVHDEDVLFLEEHLREIRLFPLAA